MELNELVNEYPIIGVVSNYQNSLNRDVLVKDLEIKNLDKGLKIVGLNEDIKERYVKDLDCSEIIKVDLLTKLYKNIIIVGNLSKNLNFKDLEFIKKILWKLNHDYHKKIVIIDNNVKTFFNLVERIVVIKGKNIIYETNDFFDNELYKYTKMPKIIEFIKYINRDKKVLNETEDIYELIKDIYRSVS